MNRRTVPAALVSALIVLAVVALYVFVVTRGRLL